MTQQEPTITVCDCCLKASCWDAVFPCDKYLIAGTIQKTAEELVTLNLEHPDYWRSGEWL